MTATCTNPECSENGIAKGMAPGTTIPPGIIIRCGVCGSECTMAEAVPEPEPK